MERRVIEGQEVLAVPTVDVLNLLGGVGPCPHCLRYPLKNPLLPIDSKQPCNLGEWNCMDPESIVWFTELSYITMKLEA